MPLFEYENKKYCLYCNKFVPEDEITISKHVMKVFALHTKNCGNDLFEGVAINYFEYLEWRLTGESRHYFVAFEKPIL